MRMCGVVEVNARLGYVGGWKGHFTQASGRMGLSASSDLVWMERRIACVDEPMTDGLMKRGQQTDKNVMATLKERDSDTLSLQTLCLSLEDTWSDPPESSYLESLQDRLKKEKGID